MLLVSGLDDPVGGGRSICRATKGAGIARDGVVGITRGGDPARGSISISATEMEPHTHARTEEGATIKIFPVTGSSCSSSTGVTSVSIQKTGNSDVEGTQWSNVRAAAACLSAIVS